jgi:hypothetical protein
MRKILFLMLKQNIPVALLSNPGKLNRKEKMMEVKNDK